MIDRFFFCSQQAYEQQDALITQQWTELQAQQVVLAEQEQEMVNELSEEEYRVRYPSREAYHSPSMFLMFDA